MSAANGDRLHSFVVRSALQREYGLELERRHGRWITAGNHPGCPYGERRWPSLQRIADVMELNTHNTPTNDKHNQAPDRGGKEST